LLAVAHDFCLALHHTDLQAATRRAKSANARLPGGNARDQLLLGNEADELLLWSATGFERRHDAGESRDLDEVAPFHKKFAYIR
jgi:hypothetical protein